MVETIWEGPPDLPKKVNDELGDLPKHLRQVLFNRKIETASEAEKFLNPSEADIHDPFLFADMDKAVIAVESAIKNQDRIAVHGDFDVDGVTSTAIITDYLVRNRGAKVTPYIPSRVDEGYGLTKQSLKPVIDKGAKLIITVDCGIRDAEIADYLKKKGIKLVVTDHHELMVEDNEIVLPRAEAVIHPDHPEGKYPFSDLAGAAVGWKLVSALEQASTPQDNYLTETAKAYLDLVALATVCDVMPLVGENRTLVKLGLDRMNDTDREGLKALIAQTGLSEKTIEAYHLGYVLGPRINAAGRLSSAMDALKLLLVTKPYLASTISDKLEQINKERQTLTESALSEALSQVTNDSDKPLLFVVSPQWEEGIIGLVAGKLTEQFYRPSIAVTTKQKKEKTSEARGSARSIKAFNIVEALNAHSDQLDRYGGHEQAAGFSIQEAKLKKFRTSMINYAEDNIDKENSARTIKIDAEIEPQNISEATVESLSSMNPTGYSNPTPVFKTGPLTITRINTLGRDKNHLKLFLLDKKTNTTVEGIWFQAPKKAMGLDEGQKIVVAGNLGINEWNGNRTVQIRIKDYKEL